MRSEASRDIQVSHLQPLIHIQEERKGNWRQPLHPTPLRCLPRRKKENTQDLIAVGNQEFYSGKWQIRGFKKPRPMIKML